MKQVFIRKKHVLVDVVPPPALERGEVLVKVAYSCVSTGTELASLRGQGDSLLKRVLKEPARKFSRLLELIREKGVDGTISKVKGSMNASVPLGYSASGIVAQASDDVKDFHIGQRVACAGAGIANHAEYVAVPRNLLVPVPHGLSLDLASTVTLGSIALQGIRRADPRMGEIVAVIGLGLLGQLTAQMLLASGCQVIGVDISQERIDMAIGAGIHLGLNPANTSVPDEVLRFSHGRGADAAIITASSKDSLIVNQAMDACRKKGRVVIVGDVGLGLCREKMYMKELDLLISTSYGPGRYDENYEIKGNDYPYHYVRWTENRNMEEYLRLLSQGKINISSLVQKTCPVEEAGALYDELASSPVPPLLSILEYDGPSDSSPRVETGSGQKISGTIGVAIVGAGAFARGVHLPNLARLKDQFRLVAIVSKRGSNAKEAAEQFNAAYATTDFQEVLKDEDVQLIIISTRHNLHAPMAMEAIRAGKGVLLEKPLAISRDELNSLKEILESSQAPFMVGFNRRFSPIAAVVRDVLKDRQNPFVLNYVMNAGYIPPEHWVHSAEGGGRNVGEACHIYDLFSFFSGGRLASISAQGITPLTRNVYRNDNFSATAKFDDGSVCNLIYTAQGNGGLAKERMEIHFEGKSIEMSDYRKLTFHGISRKNVELQSAEKGQLEELVEMARCMREGIPHPIPLWQLVQATEMSLDVEEMLG